MTGGLALGAGTKLVEPGCEERAARVETTWRVGTQSRASVASVVRWFVGQARYFEAPASTLWLRDTQHPPGLSLQDVETCGGPAGVALHPGDAGPHGDEGAFQGAVGVGDPDQSRDVGGGDESAVRAPGDPCNAMVVLPALTRP